MNKPISEKRFFQLLAWVLAVALGASAWEAHAQQRAPTPGAGMKEARVALVIGNSDYTKAPLKNPVNDANDVAGALTRLGFQVTLRTNVNRAQMRAAIRDFGQALRTGGIGLFYYAGHGVESKGRNFLIPIGANLASEFELEDEALEANTVLRAMEEAGNPTNIMIMDACRDNPFARSWRSASRGLAQMNAPSGSFIAFATAPGSVAADGSGRNSPFTKHLLSSLSQQDLDIDRVFTRVTAAVAQETGRQQVPWKTSSLTGVFSFSGDLNVSIVAPLPPPAPVAVADPTVNDRVFWESVKDSRNPEELRAYLSQFPRGLFAPLATARLRSLEAGPAAGVAAPVNPPAPPAPSALPAGLTAEEAYRQGVRLAEENSPTRNDAEAVRLFRFGADRGHGNAQVYLGFMYENGRGVPRDDVEAVRLYRLAANQGNASGQSNLGVMYASGRGVAKDDAEAVRFYRLAANQGNASAQNSLGSMYANGRGVARDDVEAVRLYRMSANQGSARAQANMGWMYENGLGVSKDDVEAARFYRLAANQGNAPAQSNLGVMYENGRGVPRDEAEAVRLYRLAANQGNAPAQSNLGAMYEYGRGVAKDDVEAARLYRLAANQGNAPAQNSLGVMYANGRGVPKDEAEAVRLYRLAANQGNARAQANLGWMYDTGRGVAKDDVEAARYYRLSANQGYAPAQSNLGVMHETGRGVPKDLMEASRFYRLAADQGNASGQFNVGDFHERGLGGLSKDLAAAKSWYRLAARQGNESAQAALRRLGESW